MRWGVRRTPEQLGHKPKKSSIKKTSYQRASEKIAKQEVKMRQKEELQRRKNELKERESKLKNLGKSNETLQNERNEASKKKAAADAKAKEKEAAAWKKKQEKELAAERKREMKEADAKRKMEEREAIEERKKAERERKREVSQKKKENEEERKTQKEVRSRKVEDLTNDELRLIVERKQLEKQYKEIMKSDKKGVVKTVGNILSRSGQDAFSTVSKKAFTYILDAALENLSGGKIESEATKSKKKANDSKKKNDNSSSTNNQRQNNAGNLNNQNLTSQQIQDLLRQLNNP